MKVNEIKEVGIVYCGQSLSTPKGTLCTYVCNVSVSKVVTNTQITYNFTLATFVVKSR